MYRKQYCGFRVKLISSQLGDVVGTVCNVTETKIELTNAIMNGMGAPIPFVAVESEFIQDLRILATGSGDSADSVTPKKEPNQSVNSVGRAGRREMLRNIPNAHSAYVCPDSPPLIHRSTDVMDNSPRSKGPFGMKSLDTALLASSPNDKRHVYKTSKQNRQERKANRRSHSFSEAAVSSEVSGTESDSFQRLQHRSVRQHPGRSFGRSHAQVSSASNRQTTKVDWDQIRVEDFIDQEFDFEKNLALFNKTEFYEMVDMQNGVSPKPVNEKPSDDRTKPLDEGPDGVGSPLMSSFCQTKRYPPVSKKDYYDDCTMTTNTATLSSARQRHEHSIPYYHPSSQAPTASNDTSVGSGYGGPCISHAVHNLASTTHRFLYTTSGLRVPGLSADEHARMLHFLATGTDLATSLTEPGAVTPAFQGLTWGRILESAGRALVDYALGQLRQPNATSQRSSRRPPARILVVPGQDDLAGAFALTMARLLASRGSSVILLCPQNTAAHAPVRKDSVYLDEMTLCLHHAPRCNPYGCAEDQTQLSDDPSDNDDDMDTEDDVNGLAEVLDSSKPDQLGPNLISLSDGESELASCFTLDHLSPHPLDLADSNPVYRIWASRIPGLKLVRRSSALSRLPPNIRIDLVILGHCPIDSQSGISPQCAQWIRSHRAISRVAHLMPCCYNSQGARTLQANALVNWIVDLGLPVLGPTGSNTTSAEAPLLAGSPPSTTHALIDIGMSRQVLLRLTSDLRLLPPYGLFDSGSVVVLKLNTSTPAPLV